MLPFTRYRSHLPVEVSVRSTQRELTFFLVLQWVPCLPVVSASKRLQHLPFVAAVCGSLALRPINVFTLRRPTNWLNKLTCQHGTGEYDADRQRIGPSTLQRRHLHSISCRLNPFWKWVVNSVKCHIYDGSSYPWKNRYTTLVLVLSVLSMNILKRMACDCGCRTSCLSRVMLKQLSLCASHTLSFIAPLMLRAKWSHLRIMTVKGCSSNILLTFCNYTTKLIYC